MPKEANYVVKKFGPTTKRRDYSHTVNNLEVRNLLSIQQNSFQWFLDKGIIDTFKNIYPIISNNERIRLEFLPKTFRIQKPENEFEEIMKAKKKGTTYNFKVYGQVRKIDEETAEVKDQEVLFGDIPLMTSGGSFIINGSEKVIVSQLLRSPGAYYGVNVRTAKSSDGELYNQLEIIPKLGLWVDLYHRVTGSSTDYVKVSIDKNKTISLSPFLRSLGMPKDVILETFGYSDVLKETLRRDKKLTEDECLDQVYGVIRRGDRVTAESKRNLYANLFFNKRRYNLSRTGRYTLNRKLNLVERITNSVLAEDLKTSTGATLHKKGTLIDFEKAKAIQSDFDNKLLPLQEIKGISTDIYANELDKNPKLKEKNKVVIVKVHGDIEDFEQQKDPIKVIANDPSSDHTILLISDIIAAISYYFNLTSGLGIDDDPDSLFNKRVVNIGELLQNQFQIGLTRMERNAKELMSSKEVEKITPKNVTNNKAIFNQFKTFFNSSQLSQFMDQMNPLAEIANKRRLTSLGPGGLNRDTANFEVRDVHPTHYGRICPIETPEGPNIGLILNFANYSRVNDLGFIETPYYQVKNGVVDLEPVYLSAFDEKNKTFAQSSTKLDENNKIIQPKITVRKDFDYVIVAPKEVDYLDVSSKQMTSIAASCIPFLENDDANRSLMGANMQRQAVPLIQTEAPYVGTGIEADIAKFSAANLRVSKPCEVTYADSEMIKVKFANKKTRTYYLRVFERSNQGSVICQKPIVKIGQKLKAGDILTDGPSFDKGELALGKNVLVAFTTWNGYNYEDAIILSEELVKDDVYTSIHIEEETIHFRKAKAGDDELTNKVPNVSNYALRNLDEHGIVRVGSEVFAGDVLVGRVSSKGEDNPTPEEKLIAAIFAKKAKNQKDTSLKVKNGRGGTIIDVQVLSRENGDDLQDGIKMTVKVFIAEKRKIKPGDKMAGRHGNKGVISRILPVEDMPHLEDGTPVDIMLNPQGVPSRMNIGQVLELHLGMAARQLKEKFVSPIFDGINYRTINEILNEANLPKEGKFSLYDPISGNKFAQKVSIGVMYMLKLAHMADDKMHSRSVGPYSLITQQPLGGKSQNGGQRFGEMETWAVEAFGATNILQELLTYKSDNIDGRNRVYNAVANGSPLPNPGTPESFNVLAYELRGLGMKLAIELKDKEKK